MSMVGKVKERVNARDKVSLWAGLCLMGAMCFMLLFYAPLELYFYNQSDFWFDVYDLFPLLVLLFLLGFAVCALLMAAAWLLSRRLYQVLLPAGVIAFLSTYIQGNFLAGNLPVVDGSDIDWEAYSSGRVQTIILWVVVTAVICVACSLLRREKFARLVRVVSLCMILMFTMTLVSILITTKGYERKKYVSTVKDEYEFSENRNFVILMLDSVDSEPLYEIMKANPEYQDIFEDFTYYANTLGAYPYTQFAVPFILSGEWYENDRDFTEYDVNVFKNSDFLASLEEKGYELGMYEVDTPYQDDSVCRFDNVLHQKRKINSFYMFAKQEIKLVGFRYAPFDFKRFCKVWGDSFLNLREDDTEYPAFKSSNLEFYERLHSSEISLTQENQFKFIHLEGAHVPYWYDKDVNLTYEADYVGTMEACLTLTGAYLDKLKEAGVYDNSVIIVMADHGTNGEDYLNPMGRQNPILFVKGVNEKHAFTVSQAPVSYADLQEAYARLLEEKSSSEIFDCQEGDIRKRRYIQYTIDEEAYLYEYVTTGHAADDGQLTPTGVEYVQ